MFDTRITPTAVVIVAAALALSVAGRARAQQPEHATGGTADVNRERVLFAEDLSREKLGSFPARLELKNGNLEIAEWQGRRYLRTAGYANFAIPLPDKLPESFILEFHYSGQKLNDLQVRFAPGSGYNWVAVSGAKGGVRGGKVSSTAPHYATGVLPVRVVANGSFVEVYVGGTRVASAPNANLGRSQVIDFRVPGSTRDPAIIGNIRVLDSRGR